MSYPVQFVSCPDYGEALAPAMDRLFTAVGWLTPERFSGQRVLLKPNLLTDRLPEEAVTTHPEFLRQVIRRFKACGATVSVGDSPASTANLEQVWRKSGIGAVCQEEGVPLIAFERNGGRAIECDGFSFSLSEPVLEADWVVNLPKVKSHALTMLTAAVKNMYGAVPGYAKTALHKRYPKPATFGRLLQTIWKRIPRSVTIVDGVVGMEGQGPANGRPVSLGFVAAAENPYAMDLALCRILGLTPSRVPYLAGAPVGEDEVELVGEIPSVASFEVPSGAHVLRLLPEWLVRLAGRLIWVRPGFDTARCIGCGKCVEACPMEALHLAADRRPRLRGEACIGCSCCHDVCPRGAIEMTQSAILRMLKVFKGLRS